MASVNLSIIIGNVGNDPTTNTLSNGDMVANFSVATSETWKDKQGQKQEKTQWHRMVCYRKLAEIVEAYVRKGSSVYCEGKIEYNKFTNKEGIEKDSTQIVINELRLLDKKGEPTTVAKEQSKSNGYQQQHDDFANFEDDIPF